MSFKNFLEKFSQNFHLNGITKEHLWKSQWEDFDRKRSTESISIIFLFYRLFLVFYFISTLILSMFCTTSGNSALWAIFLTNWTYATQTVYSIFAFCVVFTRSCKTIRREELSDKTSLLGNTHKRDLPLPEKVTWILFNVTSAIPYGVTLVFWIGLYPLQELAEGQTATCQEVSNYFVHAGNSITALVDALIVATPVHVTHFVFPLIFIFTYLIFTILYEVAGGPYPDGKTCIYPMLNWKCSPGISALWALAALFGFTLAHTIFAWGVVKLRIYLWNKISERR